MRQYRAFQQGRQRPGIRRGANMRKIRMRQALLAFAALLALDSAAPAQDVAAFYAGKTIRLVVGVDVGSGYDVNARLLARHMGHIFRAIPASSCRTSPAPAASP
jgi:hypothetical protein